VYSPKVVVLDNGNVGIGSTVPLASLQVGNNPAIPAGSLPAEAIKGNLVVDGKIYGDGSALTGLSGGITGLTTNYVTKATSATAIGNSQIFDNGTNVGIGTASPSQKLEVAGSIATTGTGDSYFTAGNVGIGTTVPVARLDLVGVGTTSATSSFIIRDSNKVARVAVLDNGYVGIGTSVPGNMLDVNGIVNVAQYQIMRGTSYTQILLNHGAGGWGFIGNNSTGVWSLGYTNTASTAMDNSVFSWTNTGNVGIGTTVPQQKLEVKGGSILGTEVAVTTAASMTVNWVNGNQQYLALNQAGHTINFSNYKVGQVLRLIVCQDGTGSRTVTTWDTSIVWASGTAPTLTAGASKCDIISFVCTNAKGTVKTFGTMVANF
jgi:hypothetical protein